MIDRKGYAIAVLQRPFPNLGSVLVGLVLVMLGLAAFLRGLEMALFPIGEEMAKDEYYGPLMLEPISASTSMTSSGSSR